MEDTKNGISNDLYMRIGMSLSFCGILPAMIIYLRTKGDRVWFKKLCKKAFMINYFGILVAVIFGYFIGCWDGNMRYATTFGVTMVNDSINARFASITPFYFVELIGYFALPRGST